MLVYSPTYFHIESINSPCLLTKGFSVENNLGCVTKLDRTSRVFDFLEDRRTAPSYLVRWVKIDFIFGW